MVTSPAIKLAGECGFWEFFECSEFNEGDVQYLERFYAKAQAQVLRDAADIFDAQGEYRGYGEQLRRMAEELEKK